MRVLTELSYRGQQTAALLAVARGEAAPDLVIVGGTVADVYSGQWIQANIEVKGSRIAYVGPRDPRLGQDTQVLDATGRRVVPGYIEPHCHPWCLYNPVSLLEVALADGVTTLVYDNLPFYLTLGDAMSPIMDAARQLPANIYWSVRIVSQSPYAGERRQFSAGRLRRLLARPDVLGVAEVTRWEAARMGDPAILRGLEAARRLRKRVEGHMAGASSRRLPALAACGFSSDHESINGREALDRLRQGLWVMLRYSSLRPDLPKLLRELQGTVHHSGRLMLTSDGSSPSFYRSRGVLSGALETAVEAGVAPIEAIRMATLYPASFWGLDDEVGGLAPGRRADINLLPEGGFRPETVICGGSAVARRGELIAPLPEFDWQGLGCRLSFAAPERWQEPALYAMPAPASGREVRLPVMVFESTVINRRQDLTLPASDGIVSLGEKRGLVYAALLDRQLRWASYGIVGGLMSDLSGLATTFTTAMGMLVLGQDPRSMAAAAAEVAAMGGGMAMAREGQVAWRRPLAVLGMMHDGGFKECVSVEEELAALAKGCGYPYHDILYTLVFLSCDFLPELRLTARGLWDVKEGRPVLAGRRLRTAGGREA